MDLLHCLVIIISTVLLYVLDTTAAFSKTGGSFLISEPGRFNLQTARWYCLRNNYRLIDIETEEKYNQVQQWVHENYNQVLGEGGTFWTDMTVNPSGGYDAFPTLSNGHKSEFKLWQRRRARLQLPRGNLRKYVLIQLGYGDDSDENGMWNAKDGFKTRALCEQNLGCHGLVVGGSTCFYLPSTVWMDYDNASSTCESSAPGARLAYISNEKRAQALTNYVIRHANEVDENVDDDRVGTKFMGQMWTGLTLNDLTSGGSSWTPDPSLWHRGFPMAGFDNVVFIVRVNRGCQQGEAIGKGYDAYGAYNTDCSTDKGFANRPASEARYVPLCQKPWSKR